MNSKLSYEQYCMDQNLLINFSDKELWNECLKRVHRFVLEDGELEDVIEGDIRVYSVALKDFEV